MNTKAGKQVSSLWLIPLLPVFLVGLFFYLVAALTCMAIGAALLDSSPALSAGPAPVGVDLVFIYEMLRLDGWLVGLVGLSTPLLAVVPGFVAAGVWEWATCRR